ncbi:MAG TPA: hotdog domain-containing protein [Marmoricola sp.]|nr:hotdog domain-containing protein [Marmoricola sp.]
MADIYSEVDLSEEQLAEELQVYGGLADAVRSLNEASLRTTVSPDLVRQAIAKLSEVDQLLRSQLIPDSFGVQVNSNGGVRAYGNAVVGMRNPIAVPVETERSDDGRAWARFHLNALYEGPPTLVHGGVSALIMDQIMGEAAAAGGRPGMTAYLTTHYRKPTPLGDLEASAWIDSFDGIKTIVKGQLGPVGGEPTIETEGLFILPKWAREVISPSRFE